MSTQAAPRYKIEHSFELCVAAMGKTDSQIKIKSLLVFVRFEMRSVRVRCRIDPIVIRLLTICSLIEVSALEKSSDVICDSEVRF